LGPTGLDNLESIRPTALARAGIQVPDHAACSLVTILTINPSNIHPPIHLSIDLFTVYITTLAIDQTICM